jgi:uncharacterized membrane protein YkvA (DUF1232 family)
MDQNNEEKQEMESSLAVRQKDPGFWREVWQQMRLVLRLIRDPEVPIYLKIVPLLGFLYLLFPFDLVTDFVPVIGQLDDLTALIVGGKVFIELAPPALVARHLRQIRADDGYETIIEGEVLSTAVSADDLDNAIILNPLPETLTEKSPEDLE